MNEPLISVIVPVFNSVQYLSESVNSIISQTYKNIEIILVDDGSTDGSPLICDEFAMEDNRVKVIHKINGGVSSARNAALDLIKGEYVSFIDSDDYIELDTYEKCLAVVNEYNAEIVKFGMIKEAESESIKEYIKYNKGFINKDEILFDYENNLLHGSVATLLFKSSVIKSIRFNENLKIRGRWAICN